MPPADASTDAGTARALAESHAEFPGTGRADSEDTLDLRLPDEFVALSRRRQRAADGHRSAPATERRSARPHRRLGADPHARGRRSTSSPYASSATCP